MTIKYHPIQMFVLGAVCILLSMFCSGKTDNTPGLTRTVSLSEKIARTNNQKAFIFLVCANNTTLQQNYGKRLQLYRDYNYIDTLSALGDTIQCTHDEFQNVYPIAAPGLSSDLTVAIHVFSRDEFIYLASEFYAEKTLPDIQFIQMIKNRLNEYKNLQENNPADFLVKIWMLARSSQKEKAVSMLQTIRAGALPPELRIYRENLEKILLPEKLIAAGKQIAQ